MEDKEETMKALVTFFGTSNVEKGRGERLAKVVDLFEIIPQVLYTKKDLNWMNVYKKFS